MELREVKAEGAPKAIGPYSQAIAAGDLIFCAGQIPLDPASGQMIEGDVKVQTERVLDNLAAILVAAGSDLAHVLKTTVYLADLTELGAMNDAYTLKFGAHRPARAMIGAGALPRGARVEIDCIATKR